jgi:hemin uptake protein HemP
VNSYNPANFPPGLRRPPQERETRPTFDRPTVRIVTSESLFQGDQEIGIEHQGSLYRLKITRQGKLILNK